MILNRSTFAGVVVALVGHGFAVALLLGMLIFLGGGGPDADLDAGERSAAFFFGLVAYGVLQLVVLGGCVVASRRLGPGSTAGLTVGWMLGLAVSLYYLGGGFSA
ncbi:hypothetical protein [Actinoplanes sp. NPDC051411]|uniref:hypothetical protein n=1 Tax=Actinoplanes sp. NPDC051411 TaxID=3155522 RepID=UPI0034283661